jgi:hypothetical protein
MDNTHLMQSLTQVFSDEAFFKKRSDDNLSFM